MWRDISLMKYANVSMLIESIANYFQPASTIINEDFLKPYSLILVSAPVDPNVLTKLSAYAAKTSTPLFYIHCVGFYAHFSIALPPAWPIVDTHPDPVSTTDLRLVKPWPALLEFVQSRTGNLEGMENDDHGHVPYLLLLLYYLEEWRKTHEGKVPSAYKEKQEFRDLVRKGMRTDTPEGGEENYEEAVSAVLKSLNEPTASSAVREVWDAEECKNLTHDVCLSPQSNVVVQEHQALISIASLLVDRVRFPGNLGDQTCQDSCASALDNKS